MTGMLSMMLDIIPVLAMLLLGVSFLRRRSACRREEKELREEIRLFREAKEQEATQGE